MGKIELYEHWFVGPLFRAYGVIWVHRGRPDRKAIRAALEGLAEGRIVALAPEGRQEVDGGLEEGTEGAAFLAMKSGAIVVPEEHREQMVGGLMGRVTRADLRAALRQRLLELEQHQDPAVAASTMLLRCAIVTHLVYNMLPSGRTVTYKAVEGEEIPNIPLADELEPESAITAATDAIVEEGAS